MVPSLRRVVAVAGLPLLLGWGLLRVRFKPGMIQLHQVDSPAQTRSPNNEAEQLEERPDRADRANRLWRKQGAELAQLVLTSAGTAKALQLHKVDVPAQNTLADTGGALPTSTCRTNEVMRGGAPSFLWSKRHNLTMYFTPKGGATAAAQIMFLLMGLFEKALAYHPWIHKYRQDVHNRGPAHEVLPTTRARVKQCAQCTDKGRCLKLIRNPLDRAVSGFLHVQRTKLKDSMPHAPSFAQWVSVLKTTIVGAEGRRQEASDNHWRPQFVAACDSSTTTRDVTHLPVEMLGDGLGVFASTHGIDGLRDPSRANISSGHYVKHTSRMLPNASHVPYAVLKTAIPLYSSFFTDPAITRDVCCIFSNDVHMYRAACRELWVSACERCAAACKRELSRLEVCDLALADSGARSNQRNESRIVAP